MILSKEFFSTIKRAINETAWRRDEFALVESVEKELRALYDSQTDRNPLMAANSPENIEPVPNKIYPPINYTPAPEPITPKQPISSTPENGLIADEKLSTQSTGSPQVAEVPVAKAENGNPGGMSATPDGMAAIDMMITSGVQQAKVAPKREAILLKNVKVEEMPDTQEEYDNIPVVV